MAASADWVSTARQSAAFHQDPYNLVNFAPCIIKILTSRLGSLFHQDAYKQLGVLFHKDDVHTIIGVLFHQDPAQFGVVFHHDEALDDEVLYTELAVSVVSSTSIQ